MILVDPRIGSADLFPLFQSLNVPCEFCTLEYGDVAFMGRGAKDVPVPVGVERKKVRDLISSLMSARLIGHQLPGLVSSFPYSWLVVEGPWRVNPQDLVEVPKGAGTWGASEPRITGTQLHGWLLTVELRGGLRIRQTRDPQDTARFLAGLYRWWTSKTFDAHQSHLALYRPPDAQIFTRPTLVREVAALLPGVGLDRSAAVDKHFPDVRALACAGETEWRKIPGIGKTLAPQIVAALQQGAEKKTRR